MGNTSMKKLGHAEVRFIAITGIFAALAVLLLASLPVRASPFTPINYGTDPRLGVPDDPGARPGP